MVLIGAKDKSIKVGAIDSIDIDDGTNTMDTNSANTIDAIGLVSTLDFIKGESCGC
jgi:hypothetical protein